MIRHGMRYMNDAALRRIVDEPRLVPGNFVYADGTRCLLGAAGNAQWGYSPPIAAVYMREGQQVVRWWVSAGQRRRRLPVSAPLAFGVAEAFDALCYRLGNGEATRLCQEAALKELASRQAPVSADSLVTV